MTDYPFPKIPFLNKNFRLSQNFSLAELLHTDQSDYYKQQQILTFTFANLLNLLRLAFVLETIRRFLGDTPIKINSGYRCFALNSKVRGATRSNHLSGCAADLAIEPTPHMLAYLQKLKDLHLIEELIPYPNKHFIHISVPPA